MRPLGDLRRTGEDHPLGLKVTLAAAEETSMRMHGRVFSALGLTLLVVGLVGAVPLAATSASAATAPAVPATFAFSGGGWGHGVGMSQTGALGMASEGATASQILTHFYTGTTVGAYRDDQSIRVNVRHRVATVRLRTEALAKGGGAVSFNTGSAKAFGKAGDVFAVGVSGTGLVVTRNGAKVLTGSSVVVKWSGTRDPVTTSGDDTIPALLNLVGSGSFATSGHRYRYGYAKIVARASGGVTLLEATNVLRLHDEYLRGIAEVPSSWPLAALQAQVVAARSYALVKYAAGKRAACDCHVYSGVSDQNFVGYVKETSAYGSAWRDAVTSTLVSGTTARTVLYKGAPAQAFYSASTGGRTQNVKDVWGGTVPYLVSVDDHWSTERKYNPTFASWGPLLRTQSQVAKAFGLPDVARIDLSSRLQSGALRAVSAWSASGARSTLTVTAFVSRLSLTSSWVRRAVSTYRGPAGALALSVGRSTAPDSRTVVIAPAGSAASYAALVAAPLAVRLRAPLLLAESTGLAAEVEADLVRRNATRAVLVGTSAQLGSPVVNQLKAIGVTPSRVSNGDRYALSVAVAKAMRVAGGTPAFAVSGNDAVSGLVAAAPAARLGRPLLLVTSTSVPAVVSTYLASLKPSSVVVVGGTGSVSAGAYAKLPHRVRISGTTIAATSALVAARYGTAMKAVSALVVTPTGAVAARAAATLGVPVLVTGDVLSPPVRAYLQSHPAIARVCSVTGSAPAAVVSAARDA